MDYKEPKIGDEIYVHTSLHVYRGVDDFMGGLAKITDIKYSDHLPKDHYNYTSIMVEGNNSTWYNWRYLLDEQEKLKEQFGDRRAFPDPDYDEEFNDPDADWVEIPKETEIATENTNEEFATLKIPIFRSKEGNHPTCAKDFSTEEYCKFIRTSKFGTLDHCAYLDPKNDRIKYNESDYGQLPTHIVPHKDCPLWKDKR